MNTKTLATGATITYGYDTCEEMTGLSFGSQAGAYHHHYTYTPAGELASRNEDDGGVNTFGYDGADQLTSEVRTGPVPFSDAYTYDHNGNRLTQTVNGQHTGYTYDDEDRLTSVTLPDGHTDSFTYNGLGMRLTKSDPTGSYS